MLYFPLLMFHHERVWSGDNLIWSDKQNDCDQSLAWSLPYSVLILMIKSEQQVFFANHITANTT